MIADIVCSEISKGLKLNFTLISSDVLNSKIREHRLVTFVQATLEFASSLKMSCR